MRENFDEIYKEVKLADLWWSETNEEKQVRSIFDKIREEQRNLPPKDIFKLDVFYRCLDILINQMKN